MCANARFSPRGPCGPRSNQDGLSLVELMVALVVSLLVGLAAAGSAMMFAASKAQAIGSGGVSLNAGTALAAIKANAAIGGLGFFNGGAALCSTLNLSSGAVVQQNNAAFAPSRITRDGENDVLDVIHGSELVAGSSVLTAVYSDATSVQLKTLLPVTVGQTVLLAPAGGNGLCTVRTVTADTAATATTFQTLAFAATGNHNAAGFATPATYAADSRVAVLGPIVWNRYRLTGGNLVLERPLAGTSAVLLRGVTMFRVQYGVAANATATTLDAWVNAEGAFAGLDASNIDRVRALRMGLMVQSPQLEKRDASGACATTTEAPAVFGSTPAAFTGTSTDWRCSRYRTATAVVPLRNFNLLSPAS
jgi:type IV pilus assembly protein PilW